MIEQRAVDEKTRGGLGVVIFFAQVVLLALFLMGYAARYVHPDHAWWLQLVALALPHLTVLVIGSGVALAVAGRWGNASVYLLLLIPIAVRFYPNAFEKSEVRGETLTVMTYNVNPTVGEERFDASFEALIAKEAPDVFALQEVIVRYPPEKNAIVVPGYLRSVLAGAAYTSRPPDTGNPHTSIYKPVFALGGIERQTVSHLGVESATGGEQSLTRAELKVGGRRVAVYNLHLRSFSNLRPWDRRDQGWGQAWRNALAEYRADFTARAIEAERIRSILDEEALPFVVCGDFNSTQHQWAYWQIAKGLRSALGAAPGWNDATFPARYSLFGIDHILASDAWSISDAKVLATSVSDHRPVIATLVLGDDP